MSNPNEENPPDAQNLPPYSEKQPYGEPALSAPLVNYGAPSPTPPQYQTYHGVPGAGVNQVAILQPPQTVFVTAVPPMKEPDYLGYSIFTLLCCFLPVGIAALYFSIKTQEANRAGSNTEARQYSRLARILSHTALGLGIGSMIVSVIIIIIFTTRFAITATNIIQDAATRP